MIEIILSGIIAALISSFILWLLQYFKGKSVYKKRKFKVVRELEQNIEEIKKIKNTSFSLDVFDLLDQSDAYNMISLKMWNIYKNQINENNPKFFDDLSEINKLIILILKKQKRDLFEIYLENILDKYNKIETHTESVK